MAERAVPVQAESVLTQPPREAVYGGIGNDCAHCGVDELAAQLGGSGGAAAREHELARLRELVRRCPAYVPALLQMGRALQRSRDPDGAGKVLLEEAGLVLESAVVASGRSASALNELAYYHLVVSGYARRAKELFEASTAAAAKLFEDGAVGLATVLIEEESLAEAAEVVRRGLLMCPDSARLRAKRDEAGSPD